MAVLRGGPSREHDVSLKTGHTILSNLPRELFTARDIYIDKQGLWHERGLPTTPDRVLRGVDVVLIGLHGAYGEDGEIQRLLEKFGVPYAGADSFGSYMAMHKVMAKEKAREAGLLIPKYRFVEREEDIVSISQEVNRTFLQPVIVKPARWGSSIGVSVVHGYAPLESAVRRLMTDGAGGVIIEELIKGREATVAVVEDLRGESLYGLPPVEILTPPKGFYSYEAKYGAASGEVCPARFLKPVTEELLRHAKTMHGELGLRHYSRSDFIVSPKGIYYLETNALPALTKDSVFPQSLASVGVTLPDFFTHLTDLALRK